MALQTLGCSVEEFGYDKRDNVLAGIAPDSRSRGQGFDDQNYSIERR